MVTRGPSAIVCWSNTRGSGKLPKLPSFPLRSAQSGKRHHFRKQLSHYRNIKDAFCSRLGLISIHFYEE